MQQINHYRYQTRRFGRMFIMPVVIGLRNCEAFVVSKTHFVENVQLRDLSMLRSSTVSILCVLRLFLEPSATRAIRYS